MLNRMSWYAVAASDNVAGLKNKGFCVTSDGEILYNEQYEYALARMYTNDGHGIVDVETSNFSFDKDASDRITINAEDPMTTPVLSYKLRMTDQYPDAEWFYFAADKSEEILEDGVPHPLYKSDGTLATKTDYADCEFEALNPMPSEFFGMYGRFTTATFSFATYQSTADVLHVEFTGLHQEEDEYCFADRLRVVVTASPAPAAYDTATGTISEITLPSSHSYTEVTFDSLRYYVKGTLSNTGTTVAFGTGTYWYYGTITWTDESLEDLSSKIKLADPSDPNDINVSQDVFRIIFITDGISGYSPKYDGYPVGGQVTAYNYNNGVHTITYYDTTNWINGADSGRLHIRYLDDITTFNNLSAFDLVTISNGVLSKDTTTDRYAMYNAWNGSITVNAKYIPSPAPALPTVNWEGGDVGSYNWIYPHGMVQVSSGESVTLYDDVSVGQYVTYDSSKTYSYSIWYASSGGSPIYGPGFLIVNSSGYIAAKNNTSSTLNLYAMRIAVCSSSSATVITVYDSSNNPYNAFQYTSDGTDYYYVLDGTQTDWTDDLSGIGYHVPVQTLELVVWVSDTIAAQTFGANDYWYSRIGSEADAQALIDFGGEVITDGQYKYIKVLNTLFYDLVNMYGGTNAPIPSADLSNFWLAKGSNNHSGSLYIRSRNAYSTAIKTWRVLITENKDNVSWMMSDQSDVFIGYAGSHQLYDASGNPIPYDSTKTYTIVGYYTNEIYVSLDKLETSNNQHFSIINYNDSGYLGIKSSDSSTSYLIQRVIYKVE